jgi:preprotein translocase subunit SecY
MIKLYSVIKNIFSIDELRSRILTTVGFLIIFRLGSFVVLPGIDPSKLQQNASGIFGLLDTFLGGAFSNASIFALGIMPYISASIVVQLLGVALPYFQKLQKEGDSGRKKMTQITRYLTIIITIFQSTAYISGTIPAEAILVQNKFLFTLSCIVILTSGTIFCMWIGEKITDKGIGNGISMLIMIGIISRFPGSIVAEALSRGMSQALLFIVEIGVLFGVVMFTVMLTQAIRRIPVQYAKQVVGSNLYGGKRQYLPLKVNSSGVMPIIFAQALMFLPAVIGLQFAENSDFFQYIATSFSNMQSWLYNVTFAVLIILFTFFYTAITVNPNKMADDMKRNNGFIPGIKPGSETSDFISNVMDRVTLPGSILLAVVAILPAFAMMFGVSQGFAQFYGGTSLLIMVGVILDTLQQIESYLLMRHYDGMMKSGKVKGRSI